MTSEYHVRPIAENELDQWQKLLDVSPQATVFHSYEWLTATGQTFVLLGCFKGGILSGGCSFVEHKVDHISNGHGSIIPYAGCLLPAATGNLVTTQTRAKEVSLALAHFLKDNYKSADLRFAPELMDLQPFIWSGYKTGVRYTYRLEISDIEAAFQNLDSTRRRNIKSFQKKAFTVSAEPSVDEPLRFSEKSFSRQGITHDFGALLRRLDSNWPARKMAFVARDTQGKAFAAVWIVWDNRRAYYLVGGHDDQSFETTGVAAALWSAIRYSATTLSLPEFDFEGSMIPEVERFFRKFGGRLTPTFTVSFSAPKTKVQRFVSRLQKLTKGWI